MRQLKELRTYIESWKDRKSTRLNSSHTVISYAVFCLKKKKNKKYRCANSTINFSVTATNSLRTSGEALRQSTSMLSLRKSTAGTLQDRIDVNTVTQCT